MSSFLDTCPFCNAIMPQIESNASSTTYHCMECISHDISSYTIKIGADNNILNEEIVLGDFYIEIDFPLNSTLISKLNVVLLSSTFEIHQALQLDLKKPQQALDKIKLLALFS